jgi:hypothetical protein
VSRTNISILLATALLGVLLWIVISIVKDLSRAPAEPLPVPATDAALDPDLPRINSRQELEDWLATQGYAAAELVNDYQSWLTDRGFPADSVLLGGVSRQPDYGAQDDATLLLMAGRGDISAAQALAEHSLRTDPLAALDWYDQAAVNGSVYAMLRIADLLATLATPGLGEFVSDAVWTDALAEIANTSPPPAERALAWTIAAVTFGGYAIVDAANAARLRNFAAPLDTDGVRRACAIAQDYVLTTAAARRAQGGAVFSTEAPAFALSSAAANTAVPCEIPVVPLVSLTGCAALEFVGPGNSLMNAWLCTDAD